MGRARSNASQSSTKSGTYRTVARNSHVDDSLFGSSKRAPAGEAGKAAAQDAATLKAAQVVTVRASDLQRMLGDAVTAEQVSSLRRAEEERKEQERAASKARKLKMLQLAQEAQQQAPLSESELVRAAADGATLSRAQQLLEEEKDEVKRMNQMVQYAKCVSIRDKQIKDKAAAMLTEEAEHKRLDLDMEIERIRALEAYRARDVQRREEQARSAAILREQLAERERQRLREEELQDQERQQMLAELQRLQHEEAEAALAKKQRAAMLLQEVAAANAEQIARKQLLAQQELEEEARIAEYIRQKDMREQALAAQAAAAARNKELEVARLRAMQEREADQQSEQDEMRARRYQEAKDREWRAKEAAAAERQAAMMADLAAARATQMRSKLVAQSQMAEVDRTEFNRVLHVNQEKAAQDASQAMARQTLSEAYKRDLLAQIQAHEEAKRAQQEEAREEGRKFRMKQLQERAALDKVKQRKMEDLSAAGVPEKYQAELSRMRISSAK